MKPNEITWAIITAPRTEQTISRTLNSLRSVGVREVVHIFAEPDAHIPKDPLIKVHWPDKKYGCFKNWARALETITGTNTYVCILSDDFVFSARLLKYIDRIPDGKWGAYSLYTVENYNVYIDRDKFGWHELKRGWAEVGGNYIFRSDLAQKIIESEAYINHRDNYEPNQQIDSFVGLWMINNHLSCWYHNPSGSEHIGQDVSTLGHEHFVRAMNFKKI